MEPIMTREVNCTSAHPARRPGSGFDRSIFLWCGIIGVALVIAVALTMTMPGPSELAAGAVPP
jgi:hypothetical protein